MPRIDFTLLIILSCVSLLSANGSSKLQIGNDLFNKILTLVSQKAIDEINKYKDNLPDLNLDLSPAKILTLKMSFTNLKFDELKYKNNEFELSANEAAKLIKIKLSKLFIYLQFRQSQFQRKL